jgi:hypothetical protein
MAAASSDQENGLLQGDQGSPSAPPPAGRFPIKVALTVGLCVFAAGLAGAVMMEKSAARAQTNIKHASSLQFVSPACAIVHLQLVSKATQEGRTIQAIDAETLDCQEESEQVCTISATLDIAGITGNDFSQCAPKICTQNDVFQLHYRNMLSMGAVGQMAISGLHVSSGTSAKETPEEPTEQEAADEDDGPIIEDEDEDDGPIIDQSEDCKTLLEALEKEAEEEGRNHEVDPSSGETLECKESELACAVVFSMYGEDVNQAKCFPAACTQETIFKDIEEEMDAVPEDAHFSGLSVSCGE